MPPDGNLGTASGDLRQEAVPHWIAPKGEPILRTVERPDVPLTLSGAAESTVALYEETILRNESRIALVEPARLGELSMLHSLAALHRVEDCDRERLTTMLFPWSRSGVTNQRNLVVDRPMLCERISRALHRLAGRPPTQKDAYILAINSLKTILNDATKSDALREKLQNDPAAEHPTLFELMPYLGVHRSLVTSSAGRFLERLRKYTWLNRRASRLLNDASEPATTPFFLLGIGGDAADRGALIKAGLDPAKGGREPDLLLLDMTIRSRSRLGMDWKKTLSGFLDVVLELYLEVGPPPVFALTDDIYCLESLAFTVLKDWDRWRLPANARGRKLPSTSLVLNTEPGFFGAAIEIGNDVPKVTANIFGTDLLKTVDAGYRLRRKLVDDGEKELGNLAGAASNVLQNLATLPGQPKAFFEYLREEFEGYQLKQRGDKYDAPAIQAELRAAREAGVAGRHHTELVEFSTSFDSIITAINKDNAGRKLFDDTLRRLEKKRERALILFPSTFLRDFASWRVEKDFFLFDIRYAVGRAITFAAPRDARELLDSFVQQPAEGKTVLICIEPSIEVIMNLLCRRSLPQRLMIQCSLPRATQLTRRLRLTSELEGAQQIAARLRSIVEELERSSSGHTAEISAFDPDAPFAGRTMIDFTGGAAAGDQFPTRRIELASGTSMRVYENSELPVYDDDDLDVFRKCAANALLPGDRVCVFTDELTDIARGILKHTVDAPEILALYHRKVLEAAEQLPGNSLSQKASHLRLRMHELDPEFDLPPSDTMKNWLDVGDLLHRPRSEVRPQAPQHFETYALFMKAIGVAEMVAEQYWIFGIAWTRSTRIKGGAHLHQVLMSIIVDPHGTLSRLPGIVDSVELWRLHELAKENIETVVSNVRES
jgi:hypothetical protein